MAIAEQILLSQEHFCMDSLGYYLAGKSTHSLVVGATRLSAKIARYLVESIIPQTLTSAPGPLKLEQPQNLTDPPPNFTVGMTHISCYASRFQWQTCRPKLSSQEKTPCCYPCKSWMHHVLTKWNLDFGERYVL